MTASNAETIISTSESPMMSGVSSLMLLTSRAGYLGQDVMLSHQGITTNCANNPF
jgi:hypothetical protein